MAGWMIKLLHVSVSALRLFRPHFFLHRCCPAPITAGDSVIGESALSWKQPRHCDSDLTAIAAPFLTTFRHLPDLKFDVSGFPAGGGAARSYGYVGAGVCERVRPRRARAAAGEFGVLPPHAESGGRAPPWQGAALPHGPLLRAGGTRRARAGRAAAACRARAR